MPKVANSFWFTGVAHSAACVRTWGAACGLAGMLLVGCGNDAKLSADRAVEHVAFLAPIGGKDVQEVREGLPEGAKHMASLWKGDADPTKEPEAARDGLERARAKVQALRVAKSTFFVLARPDGSVVRTDQPTDMMAGKNLYEAFPELRKASAGAYTETRGIMHEARGVEGKPDGQWVAAEPIRVGDAVVGLYATGWAWSLYARRMEEALKSHLLDLDKSGKQPLYYVYWVVGKSAYGTRPSPEVNARAIEALDPLAHATAGSFRAELSITDRWFGLAAKVVPELGPNVMVAVLRSET
jgi:hypothetical protein